MSEPAYTHLTIDVEVLGPGHMFGHSERWSYRVENELTGEQYEGNGPSEGWAWARVHEAVERLISDDEEQS